MIFCLKKVRTGLVLKLKEIETQNRRLEKKS